MRTSVRRPVLVAGLLTIVWSGAAAAGPVPQVPTAPAVVDTSFSEPIGPIALAEALRLALLHNPALAADAWEVRAREADALQSGRRPNPGLDLEVENFGGSGVASGFGEAETTLSLSQVVELGGKRTARLQVGERNRDLAAWDYELRRIDVLAATTRAFVAVEAAEEQLAIADELVAVSRRVLESVARRVSAGATSPVEESRARVSVQTTLIERARAARALELARGELAAQWGAGRARFSEVRGQLDAVAEPAPLDTLVRRLLGSPALQRWASERARREAVVRDAAARGTQDLSVGLGLRHFAATGDLGLVAGISVPLPVFDANQDAREAAGARMRQLDHARRATELELRSALRVRHSEATAAWEEARALSEEALPEARRAFALAEESYARGRMSLTDVLDTERTLFELRSRLVEVQRVYHSTMAELERLTGAAATPADAGPERQEP